MMGAGKTSVGKLLARKLLKVFHDSDHVIEERTGVRIPVIFELEGEPGFRARETSVLEEMTGLAGWSWRPGWRAVLSAHNREILRQRGTRWSICARALSELWNRTAARSQSSTAADADPYAVFASCTPCAIRCIAKSPT
jgi:shikimate kinase